MKPLVQAVALALLAHQAALAQEIQAVAMATVEVVGVAPSGGVGIDRRLLPYGVQTAGGDQLGAARSDNLADFLARSMSGVSVNEISGSPFQNDVTFRGFRASPVLGTAQGLSVYLDGVRVNEPFGDVVNWDMLPEASLDTVVLVPGSNPIYGLNTLGGALALTSKSGHTHPGTELEMSAGSGGRKRLDLAHGVSGPSGWHSFVGATLFDEDGWRDNSPGQLANGLLKIGRDDRVNAWSVSLLGGTSKLRGNGLLPDAFYANDRRASYSFPDQSRNRLAQATLKYTRRLARGDEASLQGYTRHSRRDTVNGDVELDDDGPEGEFNTTSTRQESQGVSALLSMRRASHRLEAGVTFDRSGVSFAQFEQDGVLTGEREVVADPEEEREAGSSVVGHARAVGVFVADTWTIAPGTHLTASARYSHARVTNTLTSERGVQPEESFAYKRLNPSLGIVREMGTSLALFANAAQGNRVPTVIELGCADPAQPCQLPVGLQSDPYLKQVLATTLEAGMRYQHRASSMSLALYRTVNRDDIIFLSSGVSRQGYFANFGRTRHQGIDMSARAAWGDWSLQASYNYLDASYDADGVLFTGARTVAIKRGTRIAGLSRHGLKIAADWQANDTLALGVDLQAASGMVSQGNEDGLVADVGEDGETLAGDFGIGGRTLVSLRADWTPSPGWALFVRVNNLFDRRHETFGAVAPNAFGADGGASNTRFVAPGAPRTLTFGVRYRF